MDENIRLPWFLIATPQLQDSNFKQSVVLMLENSPDGSMGFVVNSPSKVPLTDLVEVPKLEIPSSVPAWFGGPVETATGIILQNGPAPSGEIEISDSISLSSSEDTLTEMVDYIHTQLDAIRVDPKQSFPCLYPYRFLVGYSGWGPGQLDEEIKSGAWIQAPLSKDLLFNVPWNKMWETALNGVGVNPMTFTPVEQPYLN